MRKCSVRLVNVCDVLFTQGDAVCAVFRVRVDEKYYFQPAELQITQKAALTYGYLKCPTLKSELHDSTLTVHALLVLNTELKQPQSGVCLVILN